MATSYDGDGRRVKRVVGSTETWQVYGLSGELLAEYAANGTATSPQKEYGYRNGQLLVTVPLTSGSGGSPFTFTNDPLVAGSTTVMAVHLTELREAVNQARAHAGLSAANWGEAISAGVTTIKASHVTELRTCLDEARAALGLSAASYTDPNLTSGYAIKAAHIQELRTKTNEALTAAGPGGIDIRWLVTDQLGTPRMVIDLSGSLGGVSRHDYLPFGEELYASTGGRTTAQGYTLSDNVRQKFTSKERDNETGLDYFGARYYSSTQGRFINSDPAFGEPSSPQTWNAYDYASNNPINRIDPDGARDVPAYISKYVFANVRNMFQMALAANVSVGGVFGIGAIETLWGQAYSYKNKNNPGGMSVKENPLSYKNLDEGYAAMTILLCDRFGDTAGIHDPYQFIDAIVDGTGFKWNEVNKQYAHIVKNNIITAFGLNFFDESVLAPLRNGRAVTFNGITVSNAQELGVLLNSTVPTDQQMVGYFMSGVYNGWVNYVNNLGTGNDPNVQRIRANYALPGSSVSEEQEALYEYRLGLRRATR